MAERLLTVEFGPSRSKRFKAAVAEAQHGGGECSELEPGRYRVSFRLEQDRAVSRSLARLLEPQRCLTGEPVGSSPATGQAGNPHRPDPAAPNPTGAE